MDPYHFEPLGSRSGRNQIKSAKNHEKSTYNKIKIIPYLIFDKSLFFSTQKYDINRLRNNEKYHCIHWGIETLVSIFEGKDCIIIIMEGGNI